jgi:ubiquitin-conjugating enzyme E2 O
MSFLSTSTDDHARPMRPLEVSDGVVLKQDSSLHGFILRTPLDAHDPWEDDLIIAHTQVPLDVLNDFITSGTPPRGYVYVQWARLAAGHSLVLETDLHLLSRSFRLGDPTRRDGTHLTGTVVDVQETYTLAPVIPASPALSLPKHDTCTENCPSLLPPHLSHPRPHSLIYNVPASEVQRAQDVVRDDYIITGSWVGVVYELDYEVAVLLEDGSVVVITNPWGLHIPVPDWGKPLIALPEEEGFKRPDVLEATQGWAQTIPISFPRPGDFVIIDPHRLRHGQWLQGQYDPRTPAQGTVLDSRARELAVDWMSSSQPFEDGPLSEMPHEDVEIYAAGLKFWSSNGPNSLRKKDIVVYDVGRLPRKGRTTNEVGTSAMGPEYEPVNCGQDLDHGMRVKFRDVSAAAVKYQGLDSTTHGKFVRIPIEATGGWELNEFDVLHTEQRVTVLWQDGTVTTDASTSLSGVALFEFEISPTDIVLKRQGMLQRPVGLHGQRPGAAQEFNEMTFFEKPHDLLPESVGVVQSIDPNERVARVRWYEKPKIELRASGSMLSQRSRFGPIGDTFEDVSLYEIMSFPSLMRHRCDLCVIAHRGETKVERRKRKTRSATGNPNATDETGHGNPESNDRTTRRLTQSRSARDRSNSRARIPIPPPREPDWVGQIVAINLDGSMTVRLAGLPECRDVSVDADAVLAIIDDRMSEHGTTVDSIMDVDSDFPDFSGSEESQDSLEPIEETVEYEGGERMDDDSGDDNWLSDEDDVFEDAEEETADQDSDVSMSTGEPLVGEASGSSPAKSLHHLGTLMGTEAPPQFLVLDREPPADQFGKHSVSNAQTSLKRIIKEHKILSSSLPEGEIYVRTYESRLDLLRCLIIGPRDTPYEHAPFLVDLYLPATFPTDPPTAHFHSWTSGLGRINPNLYEEGKICLSLLGTWGGKNDTEKWNPQATLLQLLVSLQGLVFVKKPFYNEAGFEGYEADKAYTRESEQYSEKAFVMARGFVKHALLRPPGGLEDILAWLYLPHDINQPLKSLLGTVIQRGRRLLEKSDEARAAEEYSLMDAQGDKGDETKVFLKPLSRGASVMLNRSLAELEGQLEQYSSGSMHGKASVS